jgi:hypothetical protein
MAMSDGQLPAKALADAKWAFTTRRVRRADYQCALTDFAHAKPGDLLLASVEAVNQHKSLSLAGGRASTLYPGDRIVVSVGARYAPDQFEATAEIDSSGCDLIAAGGLTGRVRICHEAMSKPTALRPLALLADADGRRLNLRRYALPQRQQPIGVPVLAVVGTSMNSGKTTAAASLVRGLSKAGYKVGACKVTGTGAPGDFCAFLDGGARTVLDFTDAGYGSTYQVSLPELEQIACTLTGHLQELGCNAIVMEVADGVFQAETAALTESPVFRDLVYGVLFAAADALSAKAGVERLIGARVPVIGVSGLVTRSPLASAEAAAGLPVPVLTRAELQDPVKASNRLVAACSPRGQVGTEATMPPAAAMADAVPA